MQISIIIPTLNEEGYLPDLLQDLANQTSKQFEVIIVDGKSQDQTKEKALAFKTKLDLHFIEAPKAHLAFQRNYGAEKAKGKYLFFLDADTRLKTNVMKDVLYYVQNEGAKLYLPYIEPTNPTFINKFLFKVATYSVILLHKLRRPLAFGPLILIEKALFNEIGGFNLYTSASEDHNLVIKAYKAGVKARILRDVSVFYSTRRLDSEGTWQVLGKYLVFTAETLFKGGVYSKSIKYEMGGQHHKKRQ